MDGILGSNALIDNNVQGAFLPSVVGVYAYVIGTMLFAPLIPSPIYLIIYIVVIELLVFITYTSLGWKWDLETRMLIITAIVVGYVLGTVFYNTAIGVARHTTQNVIATNAKQQVQL